MLRDAIMDYVEGLEEAGTDMTQIFAMAHEIRNFAENAGMITAGRIAEVLCRYMDEMERLGKPVDSTIVSLHVAAIARAARAEEERCGDGRGGGRRARRRWSSGAWPKPASPEPFQAAAGSYPPLTVQNRTRPCGSPVLKPCR